MSLPSLFRSYKNKRFTYMPLYYDQRKEELAERIKRIEQEGEKVSNDNYEKNIFKGSFRNASAYRSKAGRASSFRVIIIIAILTAFILFLFSF